MRLPLRLANPDFGRGTSAAGTRCISSVAMQWLSCGAALAVLCCLRPAAVTANSCAASMPRHATSLDGPSPCAPRLVSSWRVWVSRVMMHCAADRPSSRVWRKSVTSAQRQKEKRSKGSFLGARDADSLAADG